MASTDFSYQDRSVISRTESSESGIFQQNLNHIASLNTKEVEPVVNSVAPGSKSPSSVVIHLPNKNAQQDGSGVVGVNDKLLDPEKRFSSSSNLDSNIHKNNYLNNSTNPLSPSQSGTEGSKIEDIELQPKAKTNVFTFNPKAGCRKDEELSSTVSKHYRNGDRVLRSYKGTSTAPASFNKDPNGNPAPGKWISNDNTVITSKYTLINFLPKNLFEQFLNLANLYFLIVGILQIIPQVSTTSGNPTMYQPLAFIILVSAVRAAREDIDKHNADDKRNSFKYEVLTSNGFSEMRAGDLHAGMIVKVKQNDMVPADMLFLGGQLPKGHCFIDKSNLNGETTLEVLNSILATRPYTTNETHLESLDLTLIYEPPNKRFDSIRGTLLVGGAPEVIEVPVDGKCLVMRETNLRNCEYIYGFTVYTGQDTKIQRSNSEGVKAKAKVSKIGRVLNTYLLCMLVFQCGLCFVSAIISGSELKFENWYLKLDSLTKPVVGIEAFFSWFILISQLVPISLIVSSEMVKFIQSRFIELDIALYEPRINKPTHCNNNTIHEDLGLVDFIFSDKTGTLTQNKMEFRYLLLNGDVGEWGSRETEIAKSVKLRQAELDARMKAAAEGREVQAPQPIPWSVLLKPHLPPRSEKDKENLESWSMRTCPGLINFCWGAGQALDEDEGLDVPAVTNTFTEQEKEALLRGLWGPRFNGESKEKHENRKRELRTYMIHMALSNTVKPYDDEGVIKFQAESAEELAMVSFARRCGFFKKQINPTILEIQEYDEMLQPSSKSTIVYNHVATFGFTSKRARVTVIYQEQASEKILVMMKGQDTVVLPLIQLRAGDDENTLLNDLKNMATNGLRTLVTAHSELPKEWWEPLQTKYAHVISLDSSSANEGHPDKCAKKAGGCDKCIQHAFFEEVESHAKMTYLGCVGMEDQLQPLVPECIADCLRAGIKVWMITGDKLETAKNIGLACNLIDADMTPHFSDNPSVREIVDQFQSARLLEITGQWAGLADDKEEMGKLFDIMVSDSSMSQGEIPYSSPNPSPAPASPRNRIGSNARPTSELPVEDLNFLLASLRLCVDPAKLTGVIGSTSITRENFIKLMQSASITKYDAVRHDVDEAINTFNSIKDHEAEPVSILVDRTAFQVFFPGKVVPQKTPGDPTPNPAATPSGHAGPSDEELEELRKKFFALAARSKSVVFARAEPAMKKRMVTEIQSRVPNALTLAIGDGANDTDMITAAHVGVGIAGVEGTAATNSADYAIGTFRMLHTLLFVHGFYSYHRISKLVNFIFYKASLLAFTMFLFGIFSIFSGQQFFNDPPYQLYNVIYTALPVIMVSVFDKELPSKTLSDYPVLYREARGRVFTGLRFSSWILRALIHSIVGFFIPYAAQAYINVSDPLGRTDGLWYWSMTVYFITVLTPTFLIFSEMVTVNLLHWISVFLSIAGLFLITFIMSKLYTLVPDLMGIVIQMYGSANFWLTVILAVGICLVSELIFRACKRMFFPSLTEVFQELALLPPAERKEKAQHLVSQLSQVSKAQVAAASQEDTGSHGTLERMQTIVTRSYNHSKDREHAHLRGKMIKTMLRFRNLTGSQFDSAAQAQFQNHDQMTSSQLVDKLPK